MLGYTSASSYSKRANLVVQAGGGKDVLKAPMPGTVLDIKVNEGAEVKREMLSLYLRL